MDLNYVGKIMFNFKIYIDLLSILQLNKHFIIYVRYVIKYSFQLHFCFRTNSYHKSLFADLLIGAMSVIVIRLLNFVLEDSSNIHLFLILRNYYIRCILLTISSLS